MISRTVYYVEGDNTIYNDEASALAAEKRIADQKTWWATNSTQAKYDKLLYDLKNALFVHPMTVATCSHDTIRLKALTRICNEFYETNKECLKYY